jgi:hypothetical protein
LPQRPKNGDPAASFVPSAPPGARGKGAAIEEPRSNRPDGTSGTVVSGSYSSSSVELVRREKVSCAVGWTGDRVMHIGRLPASPWAEGLVEALTCLRRLSDVASGSSEA